jgi:hypothetical protein
MDFLKDLAGLIKERRKWWLIPVAAALLAIGALLALTSGPAVAPFVYTLF